MIVDLGAENTDLIIAEGETIWLRSIPIGGNNFTEVLVKSFKLRFPKAEELKRNANTSKYARQIFQAMRPVFADLVAEIQRSIGFYSSVHRDSRIKKGGGAGRGIPPGGIAEISPAEPATGGGEAQRYGRRRPRRRQTRRHVQPKPSVARQRLWPGDTGDGESKITSSLLPMKIRREKIWRDKTKWFGAAAAIFVVGTGVALGSYYMHDLGYKAAADIRDNKIQPVMDEASKGSSGWNDVVGSGASDRMTIQNLRSTLDGRGLWIDLLGDIFSSFPPVPAGYPDDAYLKAHPRPEREMIVLDKVESVYAPDLLVGLSGAPPELGLATAAASGGQPISDPAIPAGSRGFIITLSITTPHSNGFQYVLRSLIPNLRNYDQAAMTKWNTDNPNSPAISISQRCRRRCSRVCSRSRTIQPGLQLLQASYTDVQSLLGIKPGDQSQQSFNTPQPFFGGGFRPGGGYGRRRLAAGIRHIHRACPWRRRCASFKLDPGVFLDRLTNEDLPR
jgi:hypothetical protein